MKKLFLILFVLLTIPVFVAGNGLMVDNVTITTVVL
jgi:hypothetical protein